MHDPRLRLVATALCFTLSMAIPAHAVTPGCAAMSTGVGASLNGYIPFPADSPWNTNIAAAPVDPTSADLIDSIGAGTTLHPNFGSGEYDGGNIGIPYVVVDNAQQPVEIDYTSYGGESDPGPMPIPVNAPIEGEPHPKGDRHVIVLDKSTCWLYELYGAHPQPSGAWEADSGAIFDMENPEHRPFTWTSAGAGGMPVFPGLVRYDEVATGAINHALRFTIPVTRKAFVDPATHWASTEDNPNAPPMGTHLRLKASFDISGFSKTNQVILTALKQYGMFLADNGTGIFLIGTADPRWDNDDLHRLTELTGGDFEIVQMPDIITPGSIPTGPAPTIQSFTATKISKGVYTLNWSVSNTSYVIITPSPGIVRGNSVQISTRGTTIYTLLATSEYGRVKAIIKIKAH